jgi:hypothetical protein
MRWGGCTSTRTRGKERYAAKRVPVRHRRNNRHERSSAKQLGQGGRIRGQQDTQWEVAPGSPDVGQKHEQQAA